MSDPFNSEYVSSSHTGGNKKDTPISNKIKEISQVDATATTTATLESPKFGFEPQRYGLGKPKRVIIRCKITNG